MANRHTTDDARDDGDRSGWAAARGPAHVVKEYEALWNGDFSKLHVVAEDATVHDPSAPEGVIHGREALESHVRETFRGFPDFSLETDNVLVGDDTAMLHGTVSGTFEGAFYGAPPTGRTMDLEWMARTVVLDGSVVDDRIYYDRKAMVAQLGVTFPDVLFLLPRMAAAAVRNLL